MTHGELTARLRELEATARVRGMRAKWMIGEPATAQAIDACQSSLGFDFPAALLEQVRQWDGFVVELYQQREPGGDADPLRGSFQFLDTRLIAAWTLHVRKQLSTAMDDPRIADASRDPISTMLFITYEDDIGAFVTASHKGPAEPEVRYVDMEYARDESPLELPVVATSLDDFIDKSLKHLADTLETPIYWW